MSTEKKLDFEEMINILKQLDPQSLMIIDSGAKMLLVRQNLEKQQAAC